MILSQWFLTLAVPIALSAPTQNWDLNDVTILYPLPHSTGDFSAMIAPMDSETSATPFPIDRVQFESNPKITSNFDALIYRDSLRVVGVRIDPCFRDTFQAPCARQLRLVWQPVVQDGGEWFTLDAAFHTFHALSEAEWRQLLAELNQLREPYATQTRGRPLQPHPAIVREGLTGAFARGLSSVVKKFASRRAPMRITEIVTLGGAEKNGALGRTWDFKIAEPGKDGVFTNVHAPKVADTLFEGDNFETLVNNSGDAREFSADMGGQFGVSRLEPGTENLLPLIKDSNAFRKGAPAEQAKFYRSALRIQQPSMHLPGTTDCVSCHAADAAQAWFVRNLPASVRQPVESAFAPPSKNLSANFGHTSILRSLGYAGSDPVTSARVIQESALVAKTLNSMNGK